MLIAILKPITNVLRKILFHEFIISEINFFIEKNTYKCINLIFNLTVIGANSLYLVDLFI